MPSAEWYKRGACRDYPLVLFFGVEGEATSSRNRREKAAKMVCAECEVVAECLEAGEGQEGIWGGLTASERRGKRRTKPQIERPLVFTKDVDANPWMVIDFHDTHAIWQRDNPANWHGTEWALVKNGEIIKILDDLNNTYLEFGRALHS